MSYIKQIEGFPQSLLTAEPQNLHDLIPKATVFHLPGGNQQPLFVSVLLHGNETTGFLALQKILLKYQKQTLPRPLSFFLGNTLAASKGLRRLDGQPDYNRIWPGTEFADCKEIRMTHEIVEIMRSRNVFASVDIHNNTGLNPHYACVNKMDNQFLQLANLFGRMVVYFIRPKGVQSAAFAEICPAVTLECGKPEQAHGIDHALEFLDSCLHLTQLSEHDVVPQDIAVYHTVAQVKVKDNIDFSFENRDADLLLDQELERMNFTEIPAGTQLGAVLNPHDLPIIARDEQGREITDHFFVIEENSLKLKKKSMPSMLTLNERVIRQDCLCYLMEKVKL